MFLHRLFSRSLPALDWIQVEVTSHCNAACSYCPCTRYRDRWQNRHMRLETFKKILPFCSPTSLIFLQGWGEPFLNPDFFEMIALAKNQGCRVGTTTNGTLTGKETLTRIVDLGVDIIAFSLAGTDASNDNIRKGTRLKQVLKRIECLNSLKQNRQALRPDIHIAYMLLRSGLKDMEKLPDLLAGLNLSQTVISSLDFIPDSRLAEETIVSNKGELADVLTCLNGVVEDGASRGIDIHYQISGGEPQPSCSENVLRSLMVSSDGTVSPCVFTNMPISHDDEDHQERTESYIPLHLGNIHALPLDKIWWQKKARTFRRSFAHHQYLPPCVDCPKRRIITDQAPPAHSVHDMLNILE